MKPSIFRSLAASTLLAACFSITASAQRNVTNANDSNTPLHLLQPDYPVPYGISKANDIKATLDRIHGYLNNVTPTTFVNSKTGETVSDLSKIDENTALQKGDFRLVSYEWGVTYGAMLLASQITGDGRYKEYADKRLEFIANAAPLLQKNDRRTRSIGEQKGRCAVC
jgi:unsaturated rhamnogalacturonyl hydrolase